MSMESSPKATAHSSKRHMLTVAVGVILLGLFVYFLSRGLEKSGTQIPSALIGKKAPDLNVEWIMGKESHISSESNTFSLDDFKGRPIILNFWASWCVSCRTEARDFELVWQALKGQDLAVVGIAIQTETPDAIAFAKRYGKTYMLGMDVDGKASINYGITGVPETFFIDREGRVVHKEARPVTFDLLMNQARKLF